jgi:beta-1,4-mannosyltransferase
MRRHVAKRPREAIRAVSFPPPLAYNPYQRLLHEALARQGVTVRHPGGPLSPWWVLRHGRDVDVVHLHWLEVLAFDTKRRWSATLDALRATRVLLGLLALRSSRVRVIWTVHNARPHEQRHPWLYRLLERVAAGTADAILVHSSYAARWVRAHLHPRAAIHVTPHGPYVDCYPADPRSDAEIREALRLPAADFVFLIFGQLRADKRVPDAMRAFAALDDAELRLVVAGSTGDDGLRAEIEQIAAGDERIRTEVRWIADEEVATFHRAADVVVLNYEEIFSSGALMLAWTFGRPVVAPAGGTVDEVAVPDAVHSFAEGGLADALRRARDAPRESGREAARAAARRWTWDAMAHTTALAYAGADGNYTALPQ